MVEKRMGEREMSLVSMVKGKGPSGFGYGSTAEDVTAGLDLSGEVFVVTGCNSGLGLETMRVLSLRGAHVFALARTQEKAKKAIGEAKAEATPFACELSEPSSVRSCVESILATGRKLNAVICNAGIMALPERTLGHGYELQFFTNHIGHFGLVTGLMDALAQTGRVVVTSSTAHKRAPAGGIEFDNLDAAKGYSPWGNYGQSKIANILFAHRLNQLFAGSARTAYSCHPGVIDTNLTRHMNPVARLLWSMMGPLVLKSIAEGAATQCYVATQPGLEPSAGRYFADCNVATPRKDAVDDETAKKLWDVSESILAEHA